MSFNEIKLIKEISGYLKKYSNVTFSDAGEGMITLDQSYEYDFKFYLDFIEEQFEISAVLRNFDKEINFCYILKSFLDYKSDINAVKQDFIKHIEILATHQSQIIQKRKLFFVHFFLEYADETMWHSLWGNAYFRYSNFDIPNKTRKKIIYGMSPYGEIKNHLSNILKISFDYPYYEQSMGEYGFDYIVLDDRIMVSEEKFFLKQILKKISDPLIYKIYDNHHFDRKEYKMTKYMSIFQQKSDDLSYLDAFLFLFDKSFKWIIIQEPCEDLFLFIGSDLVKIVKEVLPDWQTAIIKWPLNSMVS